jgi:hypothetical protein
MKTNYICTNLDCDYRTNVNKILTMKQLDEVVVKDGGKASNISTQCPKCKKYSTLVYISE